jgi:hypothetical protein
MWLYLVALVLIVVGLIGGILSGGILLIIFIPLGLVAIGTAVGSGLLARSAEHRTGARGHEGPHAGHPLPHTLPKSGGHVPTSPEALVDERMRQQ